MTTRINLGTNDISGCLFALAVGDRFFHIYEHDGKLTADVFRWDEASRTPRWEVKGGEPQQDNITTNPTGIVTYGHEDTGAFLFKFRPKTGVSQIFGKVPVDEEMEVRITDRRITVCKTGEEFAHLDHNQIAGSPVALSVGADWSVAMGAGLPEGMAEQLLPD